jgi:predicted RNase H-like HicB family nuclease
MFLPAGALTGTSFGILKSPHGLSLKISLCSSVAPLAKHPIVSYTFCMKLSVTIDRDEDGVWVAECPSIPGCVSQGKTKAEAVKNIKEAIELCLEVRAERGFPLTIETRQVEVTI